MIHKYFTLSILLSLWTILGWAQTTSQPNYTLQTNESGATKTYIARDYVSLKPGFNYAASGTNTFNAKIDAGLLFPPTANTYATPNGTITTDPTQGGVVGSIPGQFAVSPMGGATYSVPIACPAGINGLQPNVALTYNSQGGRGIAGWGWNISGISMISRTTKTQYYDGEKSGMVWDNTTPLTLDGQRLIEIQRWGTDSVEYKTEAESFNRIVGYQIQNWGPVNFKIYTKGGQTIQYGNSANIASYFPLEGDPLTTGFSNLSWGIVSIKDNNGNSMDYTYKTNIFQYQSKTWYRNTVLDKIIYGGNVIAGIAANQIIQFVYNSTNVTNSIDNYIDGKENYSNIILDAINVISSGTVIKKYGTTYSVADDKSHLTNVSLANDKGEHVNSLNFQWSSNDYQYSYQGNVIYEASPLVTQYQNVGYKDDIWYQRVYGDIDGDGDQDAIIRFKLAQGSNNFKYVWAAYRNDGGVFRFLYNADWDPARERNFFFLDKNNDAKDELYIGDACRPEVHSDNYIFACYKYVNNIFSRDVSSSLTYNIPYSTYPNRNNLVPFMGSFKGDGETQFVFFYMNGGKMSPVPNIEDDLDISQIPTSNNANLYITDINGNGKSELLQVTENGMSFYEYQKYKVLSRGSSASLYKKFDCIYTDTHGLKNSDKIYPGDFNGDGNTDLMIRDYPSEVWRFFISTGTELVEKEMNNTLTSNSTVQIMDINKDGKSDILFYDIVAGAQAGTYFKLLVSNGVDFEQKFSQLYSGQSFIYFNTIGKISNNKYEETLLIDPTHFRDPIIKISNNVKFDKITKVLDSHQNSTTISYDVFDSKQVKVFENSFDPSAENKTTASNYGSWDVVNSVITAAADNKMSNTTNYDFGSAIIHKQGKGFLGYLNTTVTDWTNSIVKSSNNKLNSTYYFLYPCSDTTKLKLNNTTKDISIDSVKYTVQPAGKLYTLNLTAQYSNNILGDLNSKVEYLSYDNWGNPTSIKTTKGDIVETKTINYIRKGAWCNNKVQDATSVKVFNNQSYTRTSNCEYDGKGNLTKETIDPADENKVTTEYKDFDNFGHAKTVQLTANGKTRSSKVTYTPSGRFIATKTNALNETTTYNWDETRALLNSETDYRNNTTSYKYNNWGQTTEIQYPTGIRKAQAIQWALPGNTLGAKYYAYSQTSGNAPTTVWYDALGRELQKDSYGLNAKKISVTTEYYADGKTYRTSEPYFEEDATTKIWAKTYIYDEYGRPKTVTTPMGTATSFYAGRTISLTSPEGTQETALNTSGQTLSSTVNGKTVTYTYYPSGLTKTSTPEGGQALTMEYDLQGKRTKLIDPDGGTVESKYNGFGELLWEKQKIHNNTDYVATTNNYDDKGLLQNINRNGEATVYTYNPNYKSRVDAIEIAGKNKQTFSFDAFDRITNVKEEIGTRVYNTGKEYDALGRVKKEIYPSGYYTVNMYDTYGNLSEVKDGNSRSIWKAIDENARGQLLNESKGGKVTTFGFDSRGLPTSIQSAGVVNMEYQFDNDGNLNYRADKLTNQKEMFNYDAQNRLTNWDIYKNEALVMQNNMAYDAATSNITSKSDLGNVIGKGDFIYSTMNYGGNRADGSPIGPHALTTISGVPDNFPAANLNITYTDFKKIATISEGTKYYALTYGVDDQRRMSVYSENGVPKTTRYYLGDYEEEINSLGKVRKIHYLSSAILIQNEGKADSLLYTYSDYQGSLIALTDETGAVVERYAYDPWGARRNPDDWTQKDLRVKWITNRGYTGHEHLDAFGIINMNGRVYDPLTAMFFSPDPYVQAPNNWLNYNRYGYCYGNPFRYTDPSGEFIHIIIGAVIGGVLNWGAHGFQLNMNGLAAFGIGAAGGALMAATGGAALAAAGGAGFGGFLAGAYAAGASYSVGTMFTSIGNSIYFHDPMPTDKELLQGLAFSMVTGGVINGLSDPNYDFWGLKVTPPVLKPLSIPTVGVKTSDVGVAGNGRISEIADKLKPGLIAPKSSQEFNLMIQEDNYRLTFRVETHSKLDKVFEGVTRSDLIRHANIQFEEFIDGKWQYITVPGSNTNNYHLFLNEVLKNHGY